jgi:hypothetical protein
VGAQAAREIVMSYDPSTTAILLVDPYNDFLGDGGKLWPRVKAIAEDVNLLDHLREVVSIARAREKGAAFSALGLWSAKFPFLARFRLTVPGDFS